MNKIHELLDTYFEKVQVAGNPRTMFKRKSDGLIIPFGYFINLSDELQEQVAKGELSPKVLVD